ncbi:MAG: hypothetical protein K2Y13_00240 [Burkholderiaceae bacterium]|uniref:Uncharacterized protein n=1 Tax=Herminiimonas contaminans TaxID=1111140 RepID=A0ABS0EQF9_9BURK|nr:hypothetical protein [Herminiimonas contaminans]MBF8177105.1 hypothetical protein [Herminiimonas contaminans]MBX9797861.1 hypothetical protein [Burkholderiaceae bacterium]
METLEALRLRIQACRRDSRWKSNTLSDIAFSLDNLTLAIPVIPNEIFLIYSEILSDAVLGEKPHTASFIPALFSDFDKLSDAQQDALLDILIQHASLYRSQIMQFSVGDIIARKYPCDIAIQAFKKMWESHNLHARNIAHFGANVLSLTLPREGSERNALRRLDHIMKMGSPS